MMQFYNMKEVDLKMSLLSGDSILFDNFEISPYNLGEIKDYGYSKYMYNIQIISLSVDNFIESIEDKEKRDIMDEQKDKLKVFDFYFRFGGEEMRDALMESLKMIFKTDDVLIIDDGVIAIDLKSIGAVEDEDGNIFIDEDVARSLDDEDLKLVHRDNFDDIISIVKLQNYIDKPEDSVISTKKENPADKKTAQLLEHMRKMREKVEEKKNKNKRDDEEDIDIADIISAVTSKSNSLNLTNIWRLTLYQLYDEYARLEIIDNYHLSVRAMMQGAEKIDIRHWSSKN